ncbi:MAG: bifunctional diaminohydroxyphosphoribosylaminopyrimidine deaminase/5-amino-6-(5-phosphoribosylamino)uracil reductase RibD [Elusimicrobia bacterium]|nr:bifunctional diaminohydroxyphosphoribosylaminopyrimidine deaminase/5-amino-6-(5-phosphoribosylamino)uracil reductase RibD [Elusimicrobiota bacterium]
MTETDLLIRALRLAVRGQGLVSPNPMVGAVLVKAGRVIGEGWHRCFGGDHAEVDALKRAKASPRGGTLYVNLEPCSHFGKTPPCVDALISSGIKKVVAAMPDPNPLVSGKGFRRLRQAGIEVEVGLMRKESLELNLAYLTWLKKARPLIALKAGQSLDGKISSRAGRSKWITGPEARAYGRRLRFMFDAILAGINTVLSDDPSLDYRPPLLPRALLARKRHLKIILDSRARLPLSARLWRGPSQVVVAVAKAAPESRLRALRLKGARVLVCGEQRVDVKKLMALLRPELGSVLVEGGAAVHGSFVDAGLVDLFYLFQSPLILGGEKARTSIAGRGFASPARALRMSLAAEYCLGADHLHVYRNS